MNIVIIQGSSRKDGDTHKVVQTLVNELTCDVLDLIDYDFDYYDYEHANQGDDFIPLMRKIIAQYDTLIFATPVYWYAMSGIMKVFFDRLSDLITIKKELGRELREKKMAVLSSSNGNNLGDNFWHPFTHTADYLGMEYLGNLHTISDQDNTLLIKEFVKQYLKGSITK